jgi:enoyl-CoA hydratase/carnithine racemase
MTTLIDAETRDAVAVLRMNRPDKKNALTQDMYAGLVAGLTAAEHDDAVRAVVIGGGPDAFTAGNDILDFLAAGGVDETMPVVHFIRLLARFEKPLIAAVRGLAIGIGTTMLLHCDAVVASRSTRLQLPFARLGLTPEAGSSLLLPAIAGPIVASWYLLSGEPFDGARGAEIGIVSHLVADDAVDATAAAVAAQLAALPPHAVRATKRLIRAPLHAQLPATIDREQAVFSERLASDEAKAAFTAFATRGKG